MVAPSCEYVGGIAGHRTHSFEPCCAWYMEAGHGTHAAPSAAENSPGGQGVHAVRSGVDCMPAAQGVHELCPVTAAVRPAGHGRQLEAPSLLA